LVRFSTATLIHTIHEDYKLIDTIAQLIVRVFREHKHDDRVTVPALRVCDALISHGYLNQQCDRAIELVDLIRGECFASRDIPKLVTGSSCLAHFIGGHKLANDSAMTGLLALMVNRYPRVRCAAAEQLYMGLLSLDDPTNDIELAMEALSRNSWDAPAVATKDTRKKLYGLLGLELPVFMLKDSKVRVGETIKDENATYASLVGDSGY